MNSQLTDDVIAICEQLAFLLVDPVAAEELPPDAADHAWIAKVSIDGDIKGRVEVAMSNGTARAIAASMLGVDEADVEPSMAEAAATEFANVLVGNLGPKLGDGQGAFDTPELERINTDDWTGVANDATSACFVCDEGCLIIRTVVE